MSNFDGIIEIIDRSSAVTNNHYSNKYGDDDAITDYNFNNCMHGKIPSTVDTTTQTRCTKIHAIQEQLYSDNESYHPLKNIESLLVFNENFIHTNSNNDDPEDKICEFRPCYSVIIEDDERFLPSTSTDVIQKCISHPEYIEFQNAVTALNLDDDIDDDKLEDSFVFAFFTFVLRWSRNSVTALNSTLLNALMAYMDECDVSLTLRHPKNPRYLMLPSAFKFLQIYKEKQRSLLRPEIHTAVRALKTPTSWEGIVHRLIFKFDNQVNENICLIAGLAVEPCLYEYRSKLITFYEKMKIIEKAFTTEMWTDDLLALLKNTENAPFRNYLQQSGLNLKHNISEKSNDDSLTKPKYVTGTACCGKTTFLNALKAYGGWCTPSREDLGTFSGKSRAPAYVGNLHAALDFALTRFKRSVIGDRGPIDNFIWSAIMPLCREKHAKVALDKFITILNATMNEFSIAYFNEFDTLVFVDPYSSRVQQRMLKRHTDGDQHRGRIPFYAYTQNIAYTLLAHLFGWPVVAVPYRSCEIDEEIFKHITLCLMHQHYKKADQNEMIVAKSAIRKCTRLRSIEIPPELIDTSFQKIIGIHK